MGHPLRKLHIPRIDGRSFIATSMPRRPRNLDDRPICTEVAAARIREFLFEVGRNDKDLEWGWMAHAAKSAGLNYGTARSIIHRDKTSVGPTVVEQISRHTGCPISVFYDV